MRQRLPFPAAALDPCSCGSHQEHSLDSSRSPATTSTPSTTTSPAATKREQKHAELVAFVNCLRRQGYNVPEPDANNRINTHGLPLKNTKFRAVGLTCFENPNLPSPTVGAPTKAP